MMTALFNVKDITSALEEANTLSSIIDLVQNEIDRSKFEVIGYHCLPPIGSDYSDPVSLIVGLGCTREEVKDYKTKKLYRINPFVMRPLLLARPLLWAEIFELPDLTQRDLGFIMKVKARFKGNGISIPVFGPLGHNGNVSIRIEPDTPPLSSLDTLSLQMACQQGHVNICNLLQTKSEITYSLTEREKDIIEWVVMGKSNSVIADILGISIHTVDGHLRRIYLKFNTSDRVSAAIRAIAIGAIY